MTAPAAVGMMSAMRSRWGTATAVGVAAFLVATPVLIAGALGDPSLRAEAWSSLIACTPSVLLGILVGIRRRGSPGATALVGLGAFSAVAEAVTVWGMSAATSRPWPGADLGSRVALGIWVLHFGGLVLLGLVFPDGRLPGPRWRWVGRAYAVLALTIIVSMAVAGDSTAPGWMVVGLTTAAGLLLVMGFSVACQVARYRRGDEVVRDQLRWVALGAGSVVVLWIAGEIADPLGLGTSAYLPTIAALLLLLPATVAIAVVRHDLFDVEQLLSETTTWVLTTAGAAALFAAAAGLALRAAQPLGQTGSFTLAAFVTVALIGPWHGHVHRWVARVLDRDRTRVVDGAQRFVVDVRDGRRPPQDVVAVMRDLLRDPQADVSLDLPDGAVVDINGNPCDGANPTGEVVGLAISVGPTRLGTLTLGRTSSRRDRLARLVVKEVALPIELARAQVLLWSALHDVEDSRARIVVAADEERRRLERDLHDGAQQRIVAVGMRLRMTQRQADDPAAVVAEIDTAVADLEETVRELRRLARGLRPVGLDDGLGPAVRQLVHHSPVPTTVDVEELELPESTLATAYFIVAEGVTNALKHAQPTQLAVRARRRDDGRLIVEVEDHGRGSPVPATELTTLRDRVGAIGGSLELAGRNPQGTVLRALL